MEQNFKVEREEGVNVDGIDFAQGEFLRVNPEEVDVSELLADGSIVVVSDEDMAKESEEEDAEEEVEETVTDDDSADATESLSFDGKKIVGDVSDVMTDGVMYKTFTVEGGETFKLPVDEYNQQVLNQ